VVGHLWADAPAPWEYIELILCRDVYHCRPSDLVHEDLGTISSHLICLDEEGKHSRAHRGK
jgi:hypothetical protein